MKYFAHRSSQMIMQFPQIDADDNATQIFTDKKLSTEKRLTNTSFNLRLSAATDLRYLRETIGYH